MELSRREFVTLMSSAAAALASPGLRAQTLRIRREIRSLSSADLDALRAGVAAMRALPKDNFRSWLYQSGVHHALDGESAGVADADTYWNQCVHSGLHFLSWHRWELLFIEEIIRLMSDQCNFTLPYWDYLADGFLPDPLRVPADASNTLYDDTRSVALNNGTGALSGLNTNALGVNNFAGFSSSLYGNPHSAVHGQVGGNMGSVPTAARDPVFWLHHCNIDRYWECWLKAGGAHLNPGSPWPEQTFPFHTITGTRLAAAGETGRSADLGYTYDNLPCGRTIRPELLDLIRNLRLIPVHIRPPRPLPDPPPEPWPWRSVGDFEPLTLDGRPTAIVLPKRELARTPLSQLKEGVSRVAVTLNNIEATEAARRGGHFIEVLWAPSASALRSKEGLKAAESIGSFSAFDVSVQQQHAEPKDSHGVHAGAPVPLVFEFPQSAQAALQGGRGDPAIVFVRRGLVDKAGRPLPYDEKVELFRINSIRLEAGR